MTTRLGEFRYPLLRQKEVLFFVFLLGKWGGLPYSVLILDNTNVKDQD